MMKSNKCTYIEIDNLPRQIDNSYLNDLLKKEKDHLIDSFVIKLTYFISYLFYLNNRKQDKLEE